MNNHKTILMTGITSGLGLAAAKYLMRDPTVHIVTGIRSPERQGALAELPADRLTILTLDLASLASVSRFCDEVAQSIDGGTLCALAFNAGLQITSGLTTTEDGIETTFAVNHLSHWAIFDRLKKHFAPDARIILTASGTHDPEDPIAKRFGFRGGLFPSAEAVAAGQLDPDAKPAQACLDRYATSKLCNVMQGLYWAKHEKGLSVILYDPGLMPGTGLARDRGLVERFAWSYVMPVLRPLMNGVSSPDQSGKMLARLLNAEADATSGSYVEFSGKSLEPWAFAKDVDRQNDLYHYSETTVRNHAVSNP